MRQLTGIELAQMIKELSALKGARIEKIYQKDDSFFLVVKHPGKDKVILAIVLPYAIFLAAGKPEMDQPSAFCEKLRNFLENSRIKDVFQHGLERVVTFVGDTKKGVVNVVVELFSKGNLIVCDSKGIIILPLHAQDWKDRSIRRGEKYHLPPQKMSPLHKGREEWVGCMTRKSEKNISTRLATEAGLGGQASQVLCELAGVDPKTLDISKSQAEALYDSFEALLAKIPVDSSQLQKEWEADLLKTPEDKGLKKIEAIIKSQQDSIERLQLEIIQDQQAAEAIYRNYQQVKDVLGKAVQAKDLKAVKNHPLVREIDPKKRTITMEFS